MSYFRSDLIMLIFHCSSSINVSFAHTIYTHIYIYVGVAHLLSKISKSIVAYFSFAVRSVFLWARTSTYCHVHLLFSLSLCIFVVCNWLLRCIKFLYVVSRFTFFSAKLWIPCAPFCNWNFANKKEHIKYIYCCKKKK